MSDGDPARQFSQHLNKLGLTAKAARVEDSGRMSAQRDGNNDKWWIFVPWDSHLRTSRGYAEKAAQQQFAKFSCIRELVGESFGVITITFPLSLDPKRGTEKMNIFQIRSLIRRLIPNGGYKIGTIGDYIAFKIISIEPLTGDLATLLDSSLPKLAKMEWANQPADRFDSFLRRLLAADLPVHDNDRARLEYVLDHIRQVALFGTAYEVISLKNISTEKYPRNLLKTKERPRNPKTDALATCYVPPKHQEKIPFDEIDPFAWRQYHDYVEVDATPLVEYAQMSAQMLENAPDPPGDDTGEGKSYDSKYSA